MERRWSRLFYRTRGASDFPSLYTTTLGRDPPLIIPRKRLNIRHVLPNWRRAGLAPFKCVITRRRAGRRFPPVAATIKASENVAGDALPPRLVSPKRPKPALNLIRVRRDGAVAREIRKANDRGGERGGGVASEIQRRGKIGVKLRGHCCTPLYHGTWERRWCKLTLRSWRRWRANPR